MIGPRQYADSCYKKSDHGSHKEPKIDNRMKT